RPGREYSGFKILTMAFPDLDALLVDPGDSLKSAMDRIDLNVLRTGGYGIVIVVDQEKHLLGIATDGDIRRGLLRGLSLDNPIRNVMTSNPTVATTETTKHQLLRMFDLRVRLIPVVDHQ